jgi:D-3-phosphoglycerate dehydrogenase
MKVLIADKFESWGIEELRASGFEVVSEPALSGAALRDAIVQTQCAVLIVRGTEVTADMFEASPHLGLVVRAGAGFNTIDVNAASDCGVYVANCPGKNAVAVAELTFALILALDRRIVENVLDLRQGSWNKKEYSQARGLKGRTIGIVGLGQIGRAVAQRALAFEMKVIAWSRSLTQELADELSIVRCETPGQVAGNCDILSVHVAMTPDTHQIIDAAVLERLQPGSYLITTSRAEVVDYSALEKCVRERGIRVGLDVYPDEPEGGQASFKAAIFESGVVYGTHHIGASTEQAQDAIAGETVRIVRGFAATGRAPNCLNIETQAPACGQLVVRHYDKVGVLAAVLDQLRRASINVGEMTNTPFKGGKTAVATIRVNQPIPESVIQAIAGMKDLVIQVDAKSL